MKHRKEVCGVEVDFVDARHFLERVQEWSATGERRYVVLTNPHSLMMCRRDLQMMVATRSADLVLPDGSGITLAARLLYGESYNRLPGPDLMLAALADGSRLGLRHFLYGGQPHTLELLQRRLKARFPQAIICGALSPPFRELGPDEDLEVAQTIAAAKPNIVWVGLGAPKQEKWMAAQVGRIPATALVGVGAAFDFHAGAVRRAPWWIRKCGVEWAYRLCREPRRLWRRNLDSPKFLYHVLRQRLSARDGALYGNATETASNRGCGWEAPGK